MRKLLERLNDNEGIAQGLASILLDARQMIVVPTVAIRGFRVFALGA
jgi:hypothetical protein